jgi:arginase
MSPRLPPGPGRYAVLGVPTSAGTHHAGQDRAPAALRAHGFVNRLRELGVDVCDEGDVAGEVFRADPGNPTARNLPAVLRVARRVADAVAECAAEDRVPILLGGDCTITVGALAGVQRVHADAAVLYLDGDADLSTPGHGTGILDATGVAHLLGRDGTELAALFDALPPERLVLVGHDASDDETFDAAFLAMHPGLVHFSDADLRDDPAGVADRAVGAISAHSGHVVLHFDVDAVDSGDLPLANFPHYGTGVPLATAATALARLAAVPGLAAVVLTEVNPSYDPSGAQLVRYVDAVTSALGSALGSRGAATGAGGVRGGA